MNYTTRSSMMAAFLLFASTSSRAQVSEGDVTLARKVDAYLKSEYASKRIPGMSVCVIRNDKLVFANSYGFANIELSVPATQGTVYEIASLTKPFTALAIMMLVEEGRVALTDRLTRYLPEAPATWRDITIGSAVSRNAAVAPVIYAACVQRTRQTARPAAVVLMEPVGRALAGTRLRPLHDAPAHQSPAAESAIQRPSQHFSFGSCQNG